nr:bifunctional ADP-heptose synthase [Ardenticatena sp.]
MKIFDDSTNRAVLVLGDLILDEYLSGRAVRLSREAPVPVLERTRRTLVAGGAANPAVNLARLGATVWAAGVVGNDQPGRDLRDLLRNAGVQTEGVVEDPSRPTTTKTRIVAEGSFVHGQHLARIDHLDRRPLDAPVETALVARIQHIAAQVHAIAVSNYRNGVITDGLIAACRMVRNQHDVLLCVDSQGGLNRFRGFDVVKCNRAEAESELGAPLPNQPDARLQVARLLREQCEADWFVITLGDEGMIWATPSAAGHVPPARRATVYDVTGAGDTVLAVLTLARLANMPPADACHLANLAAGLVVQVLGNYAPSRVELEILWRAHPTPPTDHEQKT